VDRRALLLPRRVMPWRGMPPAASQRLSDRTIGHLALPEQLPVTTLPAPYYLRPLPRVVHLAESSHSGQSAPDRHPVRAATRTGRQARTMTTTSANSYRWAGCAGAC